MFMFPLCEYAVKPGTEQVLARVCFIKELMI
jgi:hypothetical protein